MWRSDERFPPAALIVPTERDGGGGLERLPASADGDVRPSFVSQSWGRPRPQEGKSCLPGSKHALLSLDVNRSASVLHLAVFINKQNAFFFSRHMETDEAVKYRVVSGGGYFVLPPS